MKSFEKEDSMVSILFHGDNFAFQVVLRLHILGTLAVLLIFKCEMWVIAHSALASERVLKFFHFYFSKMPKNLTLNCFFGCKYTYNMYSNL